MKRSLLFRIHSWAGLISGLFILLMSISGTILVFHEEIDSFQYPSIQQETGKPVISIVYAYQALQKKFPHAQISSCMLPENAKQLFIFSMYDSSYQQGKQSLQVFMHPQTAEILWERGGSQDLQHNFMAWLTVFHNSFHLEQKGEWLLGFFGVIFLLSICTGILLYRKQVVSVLLFRKWMFRKRNLHQLIGVYALLFNLMIGFTGVWMQRYVFTKDFYAYRMAYTPVRKASPPLFFSIDSALQRAGETYPAFTPYVIYFASSKQAKTAVYGSRSTNLFIHSKKYADALFLDSMGHIAKTAFVSEIIPENRRDIINAQLHYGRFGGIAIKLLYSIFGITGGLLGITGCLLRIKRRKQFI